MAANENRALASGYRPNLGRGVPIRNNHPTLALVMLSATYSSDVSAHIFSLLLSVIALSALLFDIGTSAYATALSVVALATLSWHVAATDPYTERKIEITLFAFVGLIVSALAEFLHVTVLKLRDANYELARAEQEMDLLLREASHRAANDFTRVQERLFRSERNAVVPINEYIGDLCREVHSSLVGARSILIEARADPQPMQHDRALLVGLIVNELVTNALKHGFPDERGHDKRSFRVQERMHLVG